MIRYISPTDTATLLRAALKKTHPGTRFSIRTDSGRTAAVIWVSWSNGPTQKQVEETTTLFTGTAYDAASRSWLSRTAFLEGETVQYGADSIFCDLTKP